MTIEQIWAGLPKGAKLNARALALAVLDEIVNYSPDHEPEHDMSWCCRDHWAAHDLRVRIERLGTTE